MPLRALPHRSPAQAGPHLLPVVPEAQPGGGLPPSRETG